MFKLYLYICLVFVICKITYETDAQANVDAWYVGCYKLRQNATQTSLFELLDDSATGSGAAGYYRSYSNLESIPVYGSRYCRNISLPYVAVLNISKFYCIADVEILRQVSQLELEGGDACSERCSGQPLPCGNTDENSVSIYNSSNVPYMRNATFYESYRHFTHRLVEFEVTISFNRTYGLGWLNGSEFISPIPVTCSFNVRNKFIIRTRAIEQKDVFTNGVALVRCSFEHTFIEEGNYNISAEIDSAWERRIVSTNVNVTHEVPARPDIAVQLSDYQLPTCISNQHELDITRHRGTVKVYVDTPIPFMASVGQGVDMNFDWTFDNETSESVTRRPTTGSTLASHLMHTFTSLGVQTVSVNFSNPYGYVISTLAVIVVSKDIENVTVTQRRQVLLLGDRVALQFSVVTSSRYHTYVEISRDDIVITRLSVVDRIVAGVDSSLRSVGSEGYTEVTSSYGVGCTLNFVADIPDLTSEGMFNLTWSVFNNDTTINSSLPLSYAVYARIRNLKVEGHLSYEVGMVTNLNAVFASVSYNHTTSWMLINADTGQLVYSITEERVDNFTQPMNETGTFTLKCEVWNPANEREVKEVTLMITDPLGNLTVLYPDSVMIIATHHTATFTAHLDSGLGAEFFWNVTSNHNSVAHVAPTNLGLVSKSEITFVRPDVYTISVLARIGASSTAVRFVQRVRVYEPITYVTCERSKVDMSGCAITAYVRTGSDVNMAFYFPQETVTKSVAADNQTTVRPAECPNAGVYQIRVVASNHLSMLEITCPLVVLPQTGAVTADLTSSYYMQLKAQVKSVAGVVMPVNAVYSWKYGDEGEREVVSVLPFTMFTDVTPGTNVTAALRVYGINAGVTRTVPYSTYHHGQALLEHPNVVRPNEDVTVNVKNMDLYSFTEITVRLFSEECVISLTSDPTPSCTARADSPSVSAVSLTTGSDTIHSMIAVVAELPEHINLTCPRHIIADSHSDTLMSLDFGESDYEDFYAHYTWFMNERQLAYTALPHMVYELSTEGSHNVTVVATNAWGSVTRSCIARATHALIELEIKPTSVYKLNRYLELIARDPTIITLVINGPRTLANLTVDYGDGYNETYSSEDIDNLQWEHVDGARNYRLAHTYAKDMQYKVLVSVSTEQTAMNATGIIYRSMRGLKRDLLSHPWGYYYEVGEAATLMASAEVGDYITFKWTSLSGTPLEVMETTGNHSKARVRFTSLGRVSVICRVFNPSYPEGVTLDFSDALFVVVKPVDLKVVALVNNSEVSSTQLLETSSRNVSFEFRYSPGQNLGTVDLYPDFEGDLNQIMQTVATCRNTTQNKTECIARAHHVYRKAGVYNATMRVHVSPQGAYGAPLIYSDSMRLDVLPPQFVVKFMNADAVDNLMPTYYIPFTDTAEFTVELQTLEPLNESIQYHWSFGDQNEDIIDAGKVCNASNSYMTTREAGFTLTVIASTESGISVRSYAKVIVYKGIQRVELLVKDQGWTMENQGKLYLLPEEVDESVLLRIKVYPENEPFQSCHIIIGEPFHQPHISKSFKPENTNVDMHDYDKTFPSKKYRGFPPKRMVVTAACVEAQPPGSLVSTKYAEWLTVHRRLAIIYIYYETWQLVDVKVGSNLSYSCSGAEDEAVYTQYIDSVMVVNGIGESTLDFVPPKEAVYNLTCVANNGVSEKTTTLLLPVMNQTCSVSINILTRVTGPLHWYSSEVVTLLGLFSKRDCQHAQNWTVSWDVVMMVDGMEVAMDIGKANTADLYLPPRTLPPGNYIAHFIVSRPGTIFTQRTAQQLVIMRTPFKAVIASGIGRKLDMSTPQMILLDGSPSYDPDCLECELEFQWACYQLRREDLPCFTHGRFHIADSNTTVVNTTELDLRGEDGYKFVLVVFRGNESVIATQIWERTHNFNDKTMISVVAECETCTDGTGGNSSSTRPVVFRATCPSTVADCDNARYSWKVENVPSFSAAGQPLSQECKPMATHIVPTTTPLSTTVTESTASTTTSTTTPTPVINNGLGLGLGLPTEMGTGNGGEGGPGAGSPLFPFPDPNEGGGASTTAAVPSIEDIDLSGKINPTMTPRPALTTTTPEADNGTVYLEGCGCAINGDKVVSNYDLTLYEKYRAPIARLRNRTAGGLNSRDLVIHAGTLKDMSTYIVELTVESGPDVGLSYYLLTTGEHPSFIECFPSYTIRDSNGIVLAWYSLDEHAGQELYPGYDFKCNVRHQSVDLPAGAEYKYAREVYIERVPGELEIVYRSYSSLLGLQRLPAGFPEYDHQVNIEIHIVDAFGNRYITCPQGNNTVKHRIPPRDFTNQSATQYIYDLVGRESDELDWYDEAQTWGNIFTIRTNMLGVSEVLNRVSSSETLQNQIAKRVMTRRRLVVQLKETPHRYTAEVEQKLVVLKSIVKIRSELDVNATKNAADMLVGLVKSFLEYSPHDRPRDVNSTSRTVTNIASQLMGALKHGKDSYSYTNKLERVINQMLLISLSADLMPIPRLSTVTNTANGMTVISRRYTELNDETISHGDVSFTVPARLLHELDNVKDCHSANMVRYADNPFKPGINSAVSSLTLFDCSGKELENVRTVDSKAYISLALPITTNQTEAYFSKYNVSKAVMNQHIIEITKDSLPGRSLNVILKFDKVAGHTFRLAVLVSKNSSPTPLKGGYEQIHYVNTREPELPLFFDDEDIGSADRLYIAVADAKFNEGRPRFLEVTSRNYSIASWWSECVYWNTDKLDWSADGCSVTKETSLTVTHCSCNHLTAFASKREVIAMKLTSTQVDSFYKMKHYPTNTIMVSLCVTFYVILAIVSYIADRRSPVQERVIPIQDNSPSDAQRYIITIETGSEPGSGTTAKVSLVLHGEVGMSETRELVGPADTSVFQTNSRDTYLLTLPASLGPIWKVQLWHNNKGSSPGWYVKRVTVRDVESGESYYFLCEQWLAVEECDGKVEREFMALDAHIGFRVVFKVKAPQYFNDYHLIRSLIYKPTFSHFSRVERLTCVFVGLLAHMALCTAYYYTEVDEYRGQFDLFDLSSKTVLVSLAVNVVACPLMMALSMIFRRSSVGRRSTTKSKDGRKLKSSAKAADGTAGSANAHSQSQPPGSHSLLEQSILHWQSLQEWAQKQWEKRYQKALLAGEELSSVEIQMQEQVLTLASTQPGGLFSSHINQTKIGSQSDVKQLITNSDTDSQFNSSQGSSSVHSFVKSRRWVLPPWFRFVAWFLSFGCAVFCGFVTIHYSYEFQEGRFVLWLQSIFVTFLFCNFIIQPLGILMKAIVTALYYRRDPTVLQHFPDRYEEDIEEIKIRFTNLCGEDELTRGTRARQRSRYLRFARPPQERQLIAARKRTMKEKKLMRLGAECAELFLLLVLLLIIVFCCDRDKSYHLNANIKSIIATNPLTVRHQSFLNISRPGQMWDWLEHDLKELLFTEHARNLGVSVIIGNATRLKQVRVQKEACVAREHLPSWTMRDVCYPPYSSYTADKKSVMFDNETIVYSQVDSTEDAVLYGSLADYSESGYNVLLPVSEEPFAEVVRSLRSSRWIDKQTRAVFLELTLYNIPTHLYSSVTAIFEFSPSGGVLPHLDVDSAKLYRYQSSSDYVVLTSELVFIFVYLCQLYFNIMTMVQMQKRYFSQIWNILDCLYLLLSFAYIVLFLYRYEIVKLLHNELMQTFHSAFVSVAPLVFWDRLLRLLLGLLLFIIVVKTLKLFRYIKTFARLGNVYRRAAKDIRAFAVFFLLLVITWTNLGVALFQSVSLPFSDYWRGVMTVTGYLTGAVSFGEFEDSMPYWGAAYIIILTFTASGLLTALMVSTLSYHFRDFRQDTILAMDMKEAARFLMNKFRRKSRKHKDRKEDCDSQDLSPEFALAEMEYQVDELLFKMSALCDGVSLPKKTSMYYTTDSDGTLGGVDDMLSSGGSGGRDKMDDDNSLTRLLRLQGIGTAIPGDGQTYNRSQLELDVLRQLQMAHPRDDSINVWDDLRGVGVDRPFSDGLGSENEIPIHREEYHDPVVHSYRGGDSESTDSSSFISIPDESHIPYVSYCPTPPPKRKEKSRRKHRDVKSNKQSAQAEVYELVEHPRPLTPEIAYHNDAYVSDVEVELDLEFTPTPAKIGGFSKKSRSRSSKSLGSYQNQAYHDDEDCQQTNV